MSQGEGELLTVPKPRAVSLLSVYLAVKPVGEPDALIGHVRFDERGWETERCRMAKATAPILDSTLCDMPTGSELSTYRGRPEVIGGRSNDKFDPQRTPAACPDARRPFDPLPGSSTDDNRQIARHIERG